MLKSDKEIRKFLNSAESESLSVIGVQIWKGNVVKRVPVVISSNEEFNCSITYTFIYITPSIISRLEIKYVFGRGWKLISHQKVNKERISIVQEVENASKKSH